MSPTLWAVTCLFNPQHYRRRALNYREFRKRLGVPLLTVELSFDGHFELERADADILVQLRCGDVMWQKERLLNIGVGRLPAECAAVAILDSDIVFGNGDWPTLALRALETAPVVQPFEIAHYLSRGTKPFSAQAREDSAVQHSVASLASRGHSPYACLGSLTHDKGGGQAAPGLAWVYRRDLLERHGLFDGGIIGGGDTAASAASFGVLEAVETRHLMNEHQQRYYRAWATPWQMEVGGSVGFVGGDLFHLWHGDMVTRQPGLVTRHVGLSDYCFDPEQDLAGSPGEAWRWASDKPGLHRYVADYFAARRDDG